MSSPLLGRNAKIFLDGTEIGYAEGVTLSISSDLIKEYKIGSDKPAVLEAGNKTFEISIDMMYIDKSYAEKVLGGDTVTVEIAPSGSTATGEEKITVSSVVFSSWELTIAQDGVIMERVSGEGKSVSFGTY